jgi:hypothetical protein
MKSSSSEDIRIDYSYNFFYYGSMKKRIGLPHSLRPLFWDYRFSDLTWEQDQDLIIGRILAVGDWESVLWLRAQLKADDLKRWIMAHEGVGLNPPRLRFWELILGLPRRQVNTWLRSPERMIWDQRASR